MSHRQVLHNSDKDLLLNVPLNDEQEVRRQWGIPSGTIAFEYGYVSFTTDGKIELSQSVYGIKSVRLIVDIDTTTEDVIQLSSTYSISVSGGTVTATGFSTPTIYVDGIATSTVTAGKAEITITTATSFIADNIVLGYISSYLEGKIYEVQLYNIVLDSNATINLYNDARYKEPQLEHEAQLGEELIDQDDMTGGNWVGNVPVTYANEENFIDSDQSSGFIYNLFSVTSSKRYKFTFQVKDVAATAPSYGIYDHTNSGWIVTEVDYKSQINSSTYSTITVYFTTPVTCTEVRVYSVRNLDTNDDIYIKNNSTKLIAVEPTSKILHVTAKDGVARNLLSGDVNVYEVNTRDFSGFSGGDWINNADGSLTCPDGAATSIATNSTLMVSELELYRINVHLTAYQEGNLRVLVGDVDNVEWLEADLSTGWHTGAMICTDDADTDVHIMGTSNFVGTVDQLIIDKIIPEVTNVDLEIVKF